MFINADVKENAWVYQLCGAVAYDLFQTHGTSVTLNPIHVAAGNAPMET